MAEAGHGAFELSTRVNDMVRAYVLRRTEAKGEMKWEDYTTLSDGDPRRAKYRDAREKVCADAFFALRSRRARQDFVEYFTGTICSVPQYLPPGDYAGLARALLAADHWEEVKALAMLALAGLARLPERRNAQ
jgi:CRISPR-associated protein Cmx8